MGCELLDIKCIFVNELVGSAALTIVLAAIAYFIIASKNRWGFDTTIALAVPILIIFGIAITGFSVIYAFATLVIGLLIAWIFNHIIGNR